MIFVQIAFLMYAYENNYGFWFTTFILILLVGAEMSMNRKGEKND